MTITLDLPDELEQALSEEAARHGVPLTEYAVLLLTNASQPPSPPVTDGASLVEYWEREGLIGWRPDIAERGRVCTEASRGSKSTSPKRTCQVGA